MSDRAHVGLANGAIGLVEMAAQRSRKHITGFDRGSLNGLQKNRPTYFTLRLYATEVGDQGHREFTTGPSQGESFMVDVLTLCDRWHGKRKTMMGYSGNAKVQCVMSDEWPKGTTSSEMLRICAVINDALPRLTDPFHPTRVTTDLVNYGPTKELPRLW